MKRCYFRSLFNRKSLPGSGAWLACLSLWVAMPVLAGPGAHGPDGEHLSESSAEVAAAAGNPRFETHSEAFELVGELTDLGLRLWVDEYTTNEPVLEADVELELGDLSASLEYRPATADYFLSDSRILQALGEPGDYPLIFTVKATAGLDLLDARLIVAADHIHEDSGATASFTRLAAYALLPLALIIVYLLRSRFTKQRQSGGWK